MQEYFEDHALSFLFVSVKNSKQSSFLFYPVVIMIIMLMKKTTHYQSFHYFMGHMQESEMMLSYSAVITCLS